MDILYFNMMYRIYSKNNIKTDVSATGYFSDDLIFFCFEIYFILSIIIMLIFFAYLANKKTKLGYFYVVPSLINMLGFVTLLLLFLVNNNTDMSYSIFGGSYHNNLLTGFFKNVMLIGFLLFILLMKNYLDTFRNYDFEFIIMIFFSLFSSILLLNMNDLISLFFVIELQSLASYVLVASKQDSTSSTEAGLKYFILGCFSSGMVLFGISIIYGFTGLLSYHDLSLFLTTSVLFDFSTNYIISFSFVGLIIGISFLTAGLLFKFGAVPFHMWIPDVYSGSPMIIMAYLSTLPKISLTFIFMKLYYDVFSEIFYIYHTFFILVAVLSMLVGSIGAIYQVKLKRLLTYSMITNTGYVMLGLSLGDLSGVFVTILCLLSYIFITFGLFFSLVSMRDWTNNTLVSRINVFTDLFGTNPYLAFNIFILIFSLAGIPPLLGFYSKFFLFLFTLKLKIYWVVVLFVILSIVSIFYYIRLVKIMYFNRSSRHVFLREIPFWNAFFMSFIMFTNCLFFVNPNLFFKIIYNLSLYFYI